MYSAPRVWQRLLRTVLATDWRVDEGELTLWRMLNLLSSRGELSFDLLQKHELARKHKSNVQGLASMVSLYDCRRLRI